MDSWKFLAEVSYLNLDACCFLPASRVRRWWRIDDRANVARAAARGEPRALGEFADAKSGPHAVAGHTTGRRDAKKSQA